jgi:hypothetical protein
MPSLWADTLQSVEQHHLMRLLVWGAVSILAGTALLAWLRIGAQRSALLWHFAVQTAAWGLIEVAIAGVMVPNVTMRDIHSATRLDRFLWLNIGLDAGYVLVGITLVVIGWRLGRKLGLVGAGMGVVVQGLALALLDLTFAAQITL